MACRNICAGSVRAVCPFKERPGAPSRVLTGASIRFGLDRFGWGRISKLTVPNLSAGVSDVSPRTQRQERQEQGREREGPRSLWPPQRDKNRRGCNQRQGVKNVNQLICTLCMRL